MGEAGVIALCVLVVIALAWVLEWILDGRSTDSDKVLKKQIGEIKKFINRYPDQEDIAREWAEKVQRKEDNSYLISIWEYAKANETTRSAYRAGNRNPAKGPK